MPFFSELKLKLMNIVIINRMTNESDELLLKYKLVVIFPFLFGKNRRSLMNISL